MSGDILPTVLKFWFRYAIGEEVEKTKFIRAGKLQGFIVGKNFILSERSTKCKFQRARVSAQNSGTWPFDTIVHENFLTK